MRARLTHCFWLAATAALLAFAPAAEACSACFGKGDSKLTQGAMWGVLTLLVVVAGVLTGITGFFVHVARRSAALAAGTASARLAGERLND